MSNTFGNFIGKRIIENVALLVVRGQLFALDATIPDPVDSNLPTRYALLNVPAIFSAAKNQCFRCDLAVHYGFS